MIMVTFVLWDFIFTRQKQDVEHSQDSKLMLMVDLYLRFGLSAISSSVNGIISFLFS